jgi:hypothetical protein
MELSKLKPDNMKKNCLKMDTIANHLLSSLRSPSNDVEKESSQGLVSSWDIVSLLLPWATKAILRLSDDQTDNEIYWLTLEKCLQYLIVLGGNSDLSSNLLTLSVLNKLVPIAGSLAFQKIPTISKAAGNCYCILVNNFFSAPFDIASDSLLAIIQDDHDRDAAHRVIQNEDCIQKEMILSSLKLLFSRLKEANPKKSFQLLVKPNVFIALSTIYAQSKDWTSEEEAADPRPVIEALILHGLFHLEHHMDGFRSMKIEIPKSEQMVYTDEMDIDATECINNSPRKPAFHCYQEGLLSMIKEEFSYKNDLVKTSSLIQIIPSLLKCFIEQTLALQQQIRDKSTKKKAADGVKLMHLQFRFFANLSGSMMQLLDFLETREGGHKKTQHAIFVAMGKNLKLLLQHDVYLPSNEDRNEEHFSFLFYLGQVLIKHLKHHDSSSDLVAILEILNTLSKLNHMLLHEQLGQVMASCLAFEATPPEASNFFCTLIKSYKKLRQLDYFCASFVTAVDLLRSDRNSGLNGLVSLIQDPDVGSQLAEAVSSSPINQVKEIFSNMNNWIVNLRKSTDSQGSDSTQLSFSAVISVFVVLLQYVKVDINNANEIYPLCEEIVNGAVGKLLVNGRTISIIPSLAQNGVLLCGWTVALQNRCEFWMGNSRDSSKAQTQRFDLPDSILVVLSEAVDSFSAEENIFSTNQKFLLKNLQFLACQRIQRLHREIHENQQIAFATDAMEYNSDNKLAEAKKLAKFALRASNLDCEEDSGSTVPPRLDVLSNSIASWAPYIEEKDMHSFLFKLFMDVSLFELSKSSGVTFRNFNPSFLPLLEDAEFYEAPNVAATLGGALMSCVAELTQSALGDSFCFQRSNKINLCCPMGHPLWQRSTLEQLNDIIESDSNSLGGPFDIIEDEWKKKMNGAFHCLKMLKCIRASLWIEPENAIDAFDSAMRLDFVFRSIGKLEIDISTIALEIVATLREVTSEILGNVQDNENHPAIGGTETFRKLFESLSNTTAALMELDSLNTPIQVRLLNSGKQLVGAIVAYCIRHYDLLKDLAKGVQTIFNNSKSHSGGFQFLHLSTFGSCIVKELSNYESESDVSDDSDISVTNELIAQIINSIQSCTWKCALSIAFDNKPHNSLVKQNATLIVAELLKYSSFQGSSSWLTSEIRQSIEVSIVETAQDMFKKDVPPSEMNSTCYLIACLSLIGPSHDTRYNLANEIISNVIDENNVLENAFCTLVEGVDIETFERILHTLATFNAAGPEAPARFRLFRMLVLNLASSGKMSTISKTSRKFFSLSLQSLVQKKYLQNSFTNQSIQCAVALIIDMASNRDIISIRERDIALILAHVNSAMKEIDCSHKARFYPIDGKVFKSCFSMLSFLLQRFPKQLHSCVPSTTGIIAALFQHTLYGDVSEVEIVDRCQKFTRICELLLPYGEVYKKHVLSLLVEFVEALRANLDLTRKTCLSPAIYCLLDILQQHESAQLNCMLDDMGRALLRSVHKNYQKLHVYKGQ